MQDTSKTSEVAFDVNEYTAQRQWLSESDRQSIEEAIQTGDWPGLQGSAFSRLAVIDHDYSRARKLAEGSKLDLQDLWYLYYQVGKNVVHSSPEQDKWIRHILQVRKNQHRFHINKQGEISDDEITWEDGVGTMSLE
ncbi:hypothetical protein FP744_10007664 [Trichoderma asperellum]|nr:hypothetical protein LI328DRAFT_151597 [Trichoderma asperelloides]